ncbi:MAG: hypothetical protein IJ165_01075 [Proteobacteria bacterium]|nr:hypothetical protein [Pseudomonadota bacterium]
MDTATQRSQAHALIDALPQDSLEIVVALMRKLTSFSTQPAHDEPTPVLSEAQAASLSRIRAIAGCFSICQTKDWKEEKAACLQENFPL